ncbi:protein S40-4-like [Solanum dulcamara]|uniref:protein S40-4-like n=1 Tax=Solanum dulcamara TaxID=45834 RepID=UPI002486302B|nr:protein S40-4-like [Solanum dulcamara]
MATRKNFQFLGSKDQRISPSNDLQFEFDESYIWENTNITPHHSESKRLINTLRFSQKPSPPPPPARSLPMNVPDWSKILGNEYKDNNILDKEEVDAENKIPPHEYLARTRGASFSVHEGIGRTLKGRDLSRVRDAIWKQTGFED